MSSSTAAVACPLVHSAEFVEEEPTSADQSGLENTRSRLRPDSAMKGDTMANNESTELPLVPATSTVRDMLVGRRTDERGMSTAEYAVGTVGACGFGGILYTILTSDWAVEAIKSVFEKALSLF